MVRAWPSSCAHPANGLLHIPRNLFYAKAAVGVGGCGSCLVVTACLERCVGWGYELGQHGGVVYQAVPPPPLHLTSNCPGAFSTRLKEYRGSIRVPRVSTLCSMQRVSSAPATGVRRTLLLST